MNVSLWKNFAERRHANQGALWMRILYEVCRLTEEDYGFTSKDIQTKVGAVGSLSNRTFRWVRFEGVKGVRWDVKSVKVLTSKEKREEKCLFLCRDIVQKQCDEAYSGRMKAEVDNDGEIDLVNVPTELEIFVKKKHLKLEIGLSVKQG